MQMILVTAIVFLSPKNCLAHRGCTRFYLTMGLDIDAMQNKH